MENLRHHSILDVALLASMAMSVGCGHHSYSQAHPGPPVFDEREPNNESWQADFIGVIHPGSHLFVLGTVDAFGPDLYDGFAFVADVPMVVSFHLTGHNPGADVDLGVYDPTFDEFVAYYDSPWNSEDGHFSILDAGQEFHLVIETWLADTDYTLEIWGDHLGYLPGTGDLPETGQFQAFDFDQSQAVSATPSLEQAQRRQRLQAYRSSQAEEARVDGEDWETIGEFFLIDPETLTVVPAGHLHLAPGSGQLTVSGAD